MKNRTKPLLAAALTLTMLSLAACGSSSAAPAAPSTAAETQAPETTAADTAAPETTVPETAAASTAAQTQAPQTTAAAASYVYGTATLTYADFYAGDVSSTESYDAVSSATTGKAGLFSHAWTDFVDAEKNPDGYKVLGVAGVNVAVPEDQLDAYKAVNDSFKALDAAPAQFKTVSMENGKAVYGPTQFNVAQVVDNARAELKTGSNWGDYEIDVYDNEGEGAANLLRRDREDNWTINGDILGIILETSDGLKVGMEYLQSIWVQPYEVSFNVTQESTSNAHIAVGGRWDNIPELARLVSKNVTKITYIMPDAAYEYTFDGIFIKPAYTGTADVKAAFSADSAEVTVEGIPADLENPTVTVVMGTGRGRQTLVNAAALENGVVVMKDAEGKEAVYDPQQSYTVRVGSDNYADLSAAVPMGEGEVAQLQALIEEAATLEGAADDAAVKEHAEEAQALLEAADATSAQATALISELNGHLSVYRPKDENSQGQGGHGGH